MMSTHQADYHRMWLGTQGRAWRTLAVVPADDAVSTYEVARVITRLGLHHGEQVRLADMRDVRLSRVGAFLEVTQELVRRGQRVVFATRSTSNSLATLPLARAADGVVLCVSIGSTLIAAVKETIDQIGKERFLGSMLVDETGGGHHAPPSWSPAEDRLAQQGS
jgi:hypothetical protein